MAHGLRRALRRLAGGKMATWLVLFPVAVGLLYLVSNLAWQGADHNVFGLDARSGLKAGPGYQPWETALAAAAKTTAEPPATGTLASLASIGGQLPGPPLPTPTATPTRRPAVIVQSTPTPLPPPADDGGDGGQGEAPAPPAGEAPPQPTLSPPPPPTAAPPQPTAAPLPTNTPEPSALQVTICHKPSDNHPGDTKVIDVTALPEHLGHGDYLGACAGT